MRKVRFEQSVRLVERCRTVPPGPYTYPDASHCDYYYYYYYY
jgi:hypothetical protein